MKTSEVYVLFVHVTMMPADAITAVHVLHVAVSVNKAPDC